MPFTVSVPASSSNFGSGFDTLCAALSLRLECRVEAGPAGGGVRWFGTPQPPDHNIAATALEAGCRYLEFDPGSVDIHMDSPIPLARGLGSSGAAIIAGLEVAQQLAGAALASSEILRIACPLEGHPDNVAASLLGGWVLACIGDDDEISAHRLEHGLRCRFVVTVPEIEISTRRARDILPNQFTLEDAIFNIQRLGLLVHAISSNHPHLLVEATRDRFHQPYRAELIPGAAGLLSGNPWPSGLAGSLLSVTISGSGSTLVAMVQGDEAAVADWMVAELAAAGTPATTRVLELDESGVQVS